MCPITGPSLHTAPLVVHAPEGAGGMSGNGRPRSPADDLVSISALSLETGLSPSTLRAWERRYGVPVPAGRREGRRVYDRQQVEGVRAVAARIAAGERVGDAVRAELGHEAPERPPAGPVSPSELIALALAARGMSAAEGGAASGISPATVEVHRRNLIRKLGARNLTNAVAIAFHQGLLAWGDGPAGERTQLAELAAAAGRAGARDDLDEARLLLRRLLRGEGPSDPDRALFQRLRGAHAPA